MGKVTIKKTVVITAEKDNLNIMEANAIINRLKKVDSFDDINEPDYKIEISFEGPNTSKWEE